MIEFTFLDDGEELGRDIDICLSYSMTLLDSSSLAWLFEKGAEILIFSFLPNRKNDEKCQNRVTYVSQRRKGDRT